MQQIEREFEPAVHRVLNRTLKRARTVASKEIRQQTGMPASLVKRDLHGDRASRRRLEARLVAKPPSVKGGGIPLGRFGAKPLKRGVSFNTGKPAGRRRLAHAFLLTPKQGGRVVAIRRLQGGSRVTNQPKQGWNSSNRGRKPGTGYLDFPVGPSIDQVFPDVRRDARRAASRFMAKEMERELKYRAEKIWSR
ncbi:MAG: phage tail protein [Salinisphaeraceae bacterium]